MTATPTPNSEDRKETVSNGHEQAERTAARHGETVRVMTLMHAWRCDACSKPIPKGQLARVHVIPGAPPNRVYHPSCPASHQMGT